MQVRKYGHILFNKENKDFHTNDGYSVDDMSECTIFNSLQDAIDEKNCLDEPDKIEIWYIEIVYRTI